MYTPYESARSSGQFNDSDFQAPSSDPYYRSNYQTDFRSNISDNSSFPSDTSGFTSVKSEVKYSQHVFTTAAARDSHSMVFPHIHPTTDELFNEYLPSASATGTNTQNAEYPFSGTWNERQDMDNRGYTAPSFTPSNAGTLSSYQRPHVSISTNLLAPQQWTPEHTSATTDSSSPYSALPRTPASAKGNAQVVYMGSEIFGSEVPPYYPGNSMISKASPVSAKGNGQVVYVRGETFGSENPSYHPGNPTISEANLVFRSKVASDKVRMNAELKRKGPAKFLCEACGATFTAKHNLGFHMNSHNGIKPYSCEVCGETFTAPRSKDRHLKKHEESGHC
ncbi:hypothetical protein GYMLUDRAFT_71735 [Collybiopsis luxurians FD-317 M1]|uniref:Unplaced genomic scaffold GYMLUscaffold_15, whole genome shotgun sequence n=1 Tax=Collybiopsis luxurians FD-317 M1 TaxID=944289 RepID=A0A0D0C662_9AGAR|nr:hypothetical protein GYMLUDRAFT_71735 [Collybiopsis luxurians FD-317 M1]